MSTTDPQFLYMILVLPSLFGLTLLGEGIISAEIRGEAGWFTDKVFIQNHQTKTIGELLYDKTYIRREDHYDQLKEYLIKKYSLTK